MKKNSVTEVPCSFVIFGATGNLSQIKLLPALYQLERAGRLPTEMSLFAFGRRPFSEADWRSFMEEALRKKLGDIFDNALFDRFAQRFSYVQGELHSQEDYGKLKESLATPKMGGYANVIFYLAIKPTEFGAVINNLDKSGLNKPRGLHRIVVEKPFGEDIETAQMLNGLLHKHFDEEQVYRIDHYLGKESVQNLMVFRFANTLIEPLWNRNFIDQGIRKAEHH